MNRRTLEHIREVVCVPYGDIHLSLYMKGIMALFWLVQLALGFLYGAPPAFFLLLGGMLLLNSVNILSHCRIGRGLEHCAAASGLQCRDIPAVLCGLFQLVFPLSFLLHLHFRAGPPGRHSGQPTEPLVGGRLSVRRADARPCRRLRRELSAPVPLPVFLHHGRRPHHHVLHPALLAGQDPTPHLITGPHRRGKAEAL